MMKKKSEDRTFVELTVIKNIMEQFKYFKLLSRRITAEQLNMIYNEVKMKKYSKDQTIFKEGRAISKRHIFIYF